MTSEREPQRLPSPDGEPRERDASDVIEGEIGHARLRCPQDQGEMGADLDKLPGADSPSEGTRTDGT